DEFDAPLLAPPAPTGGTKAVVEAHEPAPEPVSGLPQRPWRTGIVDIGALPATRTVADAPSRVRATCILLAGEDPAELEAAGSSALEQTTPFDEVLVAELDPE